MYRTQQNLEFINRHKDHDGPFEITQLINSFLAVVAHPWDQLLDKDKLNDIGLDSRVMRECGFPDIPNLPVEGNPAPMTSAYDLLRVLRNGMAHGNMELLDRRALRDLRQYGPLPRVAEGEIAGIRIWNRKSESDPITWCTALNIHELEQIVTAMMRLCEKRSLWIDAERLSQDQRDAERKARRA